MERKIKSILIVSGITTILVVLFVTLYYCVFNKQHTGPMDWWAIILLVIPAVVVMTSRILIDILSIDVDESFKGKTFWGKIAVLINKIVMGIATVFALPIGIIYLIIILISDCFSIPGKKSFKKLLKKGFQYEYKHKTYFLTRNEIVIRVLLNFEDYYISFDNGKNFVRVEESNLGSRCDRELLRSKLNEYRNAHPVDKQRGDALPPISEFIDFLDNNLIFNN